MTNEQILEEIKITEKELSNYNDDELLIWIDLAVNFLIGAGGKSEIVRSKRAIGVIALCVNGYRLKKPEFGQIASMHIVQLALEG